MKKLILWLALGAAYCLLPTADCYAQAGGATTPPERHDYKNLILGAQVPTPAAGQWNISLDSSGNVIATKPDGSTLTLVPSTGTVGGTGTANQLAGWTGSNTLGAVNLYTDTANTLTLKNGTNAQRLRFYTDATVGKQVEVGSVASGGGAWSINAAHAAPGAATVALAGAGAGSVDNGAHSYKVTFVTATGETDAGTASAQVTVADKTVNGKIALSAIPIGNSNVTSRKIYRTVAGDTGSYLLVGTISDNTTTTFTDNIADSSLGAQIPSTNSTLDRIFFARAIGSAAGSGFVIAGNTSLIMSTLSGAAGGSLTVDSTGQWNLTQNAANVDLVYKIVAGTGTHKFLVNSSTTALQLNADGSVTTGGAINKVTITAPATGSTLTIDDGETARFSNSLTLSGADGKTINFGSNSITLTTSADASLTLPTSGTLATLAGSETLSGKTLIAPVLGVASATSVALTGTAGAGFEEYPTQSSNPSAPSSGFREFADSTGRKSWIRASDGFVRTWDATLTASRVYTLPDANSSLPVYTQTITYSGPTAARTVTYPDSNFTAARTDAGQTFTGTNVFTSPKIVTGINDTNGITATASAVDYVNVTNAATANPAQVTLAATGSDSNIHLALNAKGTGKVQLGSSSATVDSSGNLTVTSCTGCGATTINSTDNFIPYRSNSTTFADTPFNRVDANTIYQRNSTNAQTLKVMGTYTDSTHYSGIQLIADASGLQYTIGGTLVGTTGNGVDVHVQGTNSVGLNKQGGNLYFDAGLGTGNKNGGVFAWQTSASGASSSTAGSYTIIGQLYLNAADTATVLELGVPGAGGASGNILLYNVSNSNTVTIVPGTPTANRTVTIPDASTTIPVASQTITFSGPTAARTYTLPDSASTLAALATAQTWTAKQTINAALVPVAASSLTDNGSTIATDASLGNYFHVTALTANVTLSNPTNATDGQQVTWDILQNASSAKTLAFGTQFRMPGS